VYSVRMARCQVDPKLKAIRMGGLTFPLGVYPVEPMTPRAGYSVVFEPADTDGGDGEWEEWPDRYALDIVVTSERLGALTTHLLAMLPGRVYPILDVMGHDAYREIDPYISYELIGQDLFVDAFRRYRPFLLEDGLVGFGAMSDDPFFYVFVDEHKIVTVRVQADARERVEKLLRAMDLEPVDEPAGADAASHEHRGVLYAPDSRRDLMNSDEITEALRDEWRLTLNVDPQENVDDEGEPLGVTAWRCLVRCRQPETDAAYRYAEVLAFAPCLLDAEEFAQTAAMDLSESSARQPEGEVGLDQIDPDLLVITADRILPEEMTQALGEAGVRPPGDDESPVGALAARWLT